MRRFFTHLFGASFCRCVLFAKKFNCIGDSLLWRFFLRSVADARIGDQFRIGDLTLDFATLLYGNKDVIFPQRISVGAVIAITLPTGLAV